MFAGISIVSLTPSVLLGITVLMIFVGRLWTNSAYQEKCKEAERWRKAYETEKEARATSDAQTRELLEVGKSTYALLDAVFSTNEPQSKGGAHRVVPSSRKVGQ